MSKLAVATRLSDEVGVSLAKARRFVDDVGLDSARSAADNAAEGAVRVASDWWRPAVAVGGIGGAGYLTYRQQNVWEQQAEASNTQSYGEAVRLLLESDLPPEVRRQLLEDLNERQNRDSEDDADDGDNPLSNLFGNMGGLQITLGLVVILIIFLQFGGDE